MRIEFYSHSGLSSVHGDDEEAEKIDEGLYSIEASGRGRENAHELKRERKDNKLGAWALHGHLVIFPSSAMLSSNREMDSMFKT